MLRGRIGHGKGIHGRRGSSGPEPGFQPGQGQHRPGGGFAIAETPPAVLRHGRRMRYTSSCRKRGMFRSSFPRRSRSRTGFPSRPLYRPQHRGANWRWRPAELCWRSAWSRGSFCSPGRTLRAPEPSQRPASSPSCLPRRRGKRFASWRASQDRNTSTDSDAPGSATVG